MALLQILCVCALCLPFYQDEPNTVMIKLSSLSLVSLSLFKFLSNGLGGSVCGIVTKTVHTSGFNQIS